MGIRGKILTQVLLAERGVNLTDAIQDVRPAHALLTQNCVFRHGMIKKLGSSKHSVTEVVAGKKIVGLHRFYYGANNRQLLAAAGTTVKHMDDGTGLWTDLGQVQTDNLDTFITTWSSVNKAYISNGANAPFSWDGTAVGTLTGWPTTTKHILPYRDRLLFVDTTKPSIVQVTDGGVNAYTDTFPGTAGGDLIQITQGGTIEVIAPHALAGPQEGVLGFVIIGTASSLALMSGTNLDATGSAGDVRLDHVSNIVGSVSPRTFVSTPKGTIFLGSDRQVYLLPFGSLDLIPIGHNIQSRTTITEGIESIPPAQMTKAAATYHRGFYKLSFAGTGQSVNNLQYWLDVDRLRLDEAARATPWYGPMIGMEIGMFTYQNGSGDDGRLIGGNSNATAIVFRTNETSIFSDDGSTIPVVYTTNPVYASKANDVKVSQIELELLSTDDTITVNFDDITTPLSQGNLVILNESRVTWSQQNWNTFSWQTFGSTVRKKLQLYNNGICARGLKTTFRQSSDSVDFQLYSYVVEGKMARKSFSKALVG